MSDALNDARAVIAHFRQMLGADGSELTLRYVHGNVLHVSYRRGECDDCVLDPDDLKGMMEELLQRRRSSLNKVELTGVESAARL